MSREQYTARRERDDRSLVFLVKLERIADQILKELQKSYQDTLASMQNSLMQMQNVSAM